MSAVAAVLLLPLAGCGGGEAQDENEPDADFRVEVVDASFPEEQKLAKRSTMEITVKNVDQRTIPNIAVTVKSFDRKKQDTELADPSRPVFVVNRGPSGSDSAYVDTYSLGPLRAGEEKRFTWNVTAVLAGPYKLDWRVAAGLHGKAKAIDADGGGAPSGTFQGRIEDEPPDTKVAEDGKTVVPAEDGE